MFILALSIGILSYAIFIAGITYTLSYHVVYLLTFLWGGTIGFFILKSIRTHVKRKNVLLFSYKTIVSKKNYFFIIITVCLFLQMGINLIGAIGPEIAFDALWYHLTLPKIYLQNHAITFIPGGLLYYSAMPKLTEMVYIIALALQGEIAAKLIHFTFGILCCVALFKFATLYMSRFLALLTVLIFYSNLVVAWESTTAYIDLARAFYEILAVHAFLMWYASGKRVWFVICSVMIGFAITTKLLAFGSLFIFVLLITGILYLKRLSVARIIREVLLFICIAISITFPWFIFSYTVTGNPLYPFFTSLYATDISFSLLNPIHFISDIWIIFVKSDDPLSPLYLMFIPVVFVLYKSFPKSIKLLCIYALVSFMCWYITPRTGGGRFILPYLPVFSVLVGYCIFTLKKDIFLYRFSLSLVILVSFITIFYRGAANIRYVPVVFGQESQSTFLSRELHFDYGDFYDTDNYFSQTIKNSDKVLLYGFHNLYYVNFPFIHESWVKKGDTFNYIATQNTKLPDRFKEWNLIYENKKTFVKLYKLEGKETTY